MESCFAFTCCSKWNHGNGGSLIMGKTLEGELPERGQELRMRMVTHLQDLYEDHQNLKMGTLLQKLLVVMTQDDIDGYKSHATGDEPLTNTQTRRRQWRFLISFPTSRRKRHHLPRHYVLTGHGNSGARCNNRWLHGRT
jgi:hypothetical protein